ncbi:MAG TPA: hypothetical protein P5534_18690, partial [Candidatus Paceibacterota bacterium]|nr:hypothetical protein [Candidatus Paceibacterota bacterium]
MISSTRERRVLPVCHSPAPRAWLALVLALLGVPGFAGSDLVITEFMADNDGVLADGFGRYSDWVEIHNLGSR